LHNLLLVSRNLEQGKHENKLLKVKSCSKRMVNNARRIAGIIYTNSINWMFYLGVGKMDESKALIAVTSCSNYKINNEASIHFNKHK